MKSGFTLIELVLYIGLMAIILPSLVLMMLQIHKNQQHVYTRTAIENSSAIILSKLEYELTHADKILISTSTLNSNQSILIFENSDSEICRFEYKTDTVDFSNTQYNIGRLNYLNQTNKWLTSNNVAIIVFRVEPIRNNDSQLTGLNINITLSPLSTETVIDQSNILELETSIRIPLSITEE